jgi:glutathione synthase/RimK-type ligase-like ATP-grasp enzyme
MTKPAPTIALLTCRHHDHIDHASEGKLMQELVRQGAAVTLAAWDDVLTPVKDEDSPLLGEMVSADVYVLRTTWDYWDRLDRFREFLTVFSKSEDGGGGLHNSGKTTLANLDKTYLRELESADVPIVPTIFVTKGNEAAAIDQAKANNWPPLIIKPTVGAAAVGLRKFDRPDNTAADYLTELTKTGGALIQPYLPRITTEGETSLVYFDGIFSHAVTKVPAPGDFRSQVDFGGAYTLVEPTEQQLHVAELALLAWESKYGDKPLYARVDLVPGHDGQPLLGELELIEPELFLDMADHAAELFATAILARVKRSEPLAQGRLARLGEGVGCVVLFAALIIVFSTGVAVIVAWIIGLLTGGP